MAVTKLQDSGGTIGLDEEGYSSFNAEQIAINLSRTQYRKNLKAKGEITGVYEAAMNYVRPMSVSQKQRMLASYGDASQLPRNATVEQLNAQLVETLIIRLTDKELKNLINKSNSANKKLLNELDGASKGSSTFSLNSLSMVKFDPSNMNGSKKNDIVKQINQLDDNFIVNKTFSQKTYGFGGLVKEIDKLLAALNPTELGAELVKLGIPGVYKDTVARKMIAYRCCAYLALVTGKAKDNMIHGVYGGEIEQEYVYLIAQTSYGIYLPGYQKVSPSNVRFSKNGDIKIKDDTKNRLFNKVLRRGQNAKVRFRKDLKGKEKRMFGKFAITRFINLHTIGGRRRIIERNNGEFYRPDDFIRTCSTLLSENTENAEFVNYTEIAIRATLTEIKNNPKKFGIYNDQISNIQDQNISEAASQSSTNANINKVFSENIIKQFDVKLDENMSDAQKTETIVAAIFNKINKANADNGKNRISNMLLILNSLGNDAFKSFIENMKKLLKNKLQNVIDGFKIDDPKLSCRTLVVLYIKNIMTKVRAMVRGVNGTGLKGMIRRKVEKEVSKTKSMLFSNLRGKVEMTRDARAQVVSQISNQNNFETNSDGTFKLDKDGNPISTGGGNDARNSDIEKLMVSTNIIRASETNDYLALPVYSVNTQVKVNNGIAENVGDKSNVLAVAIAGYTQDAINAFKGINQTSSSSTESTDKIPNVFKKVLTGNQITGLEAIADQDVSDFANGVGNLYSKVIDKTNEKIDKHKNAVSAHENERKNYSALINEAKNAIDIANNALPSDDKKGKYGNSGGKFAARPVNRFYRTLYDKNYWSEYSRLYFKGDIWMNNNVTPVFVLNNYDKTYSSMLTHLENTADNTSSIAEFLTDTLPIMWMTLQQVGLSTNAASAGGASAKAVSIVNTIADTALSKLKEHAKGAVISGGTSFISGDTLTGRPNPEMVNVNWADHTVSVKPVTFKNNVPHFATGGTNTTEKTERLSTSERVAPLNVAVASGLVKYSSKELIGATDDGTNTAIKVYNMNSPLTETVVYEGTEITLVDILYGLGTGITNIGNILTNQTSILSTIANNTANSNNTTVVESSSSGFTFPTNLDSILKGE